MKRNSDIQWMSERNREKMRKWVTLGVGALGERQKVRKRESERERGNKQREIVGVFEEREIRRRRQRKVGEK